MNLDTCLLAKYTAFKTSLRSVVDYFLSWWSAYLKSVSVVEIFPTDLTLYLLHISSTNDQGRQDVRKVARPTRLEAKLERISVLWNWTFCESALSANYAHDSLALPQESRLREVNDYTSSLSRIRLMAFSISGYDTLPSSTSLTKESCSPELGI